MAKIIINAAVAQRVLSTVDEGLCWGLGQPKVGKMCVEAAVCYALDLPHGDNPPCVNQLVRTLKIELNDSNIWGSNKTRAAGLRRLAIAQLGTAEAFDEALFTTKLVAAVLKTYAKEYEEPGFLVGLEDYSKLDWGLLDKIKGDSYWLRELINAVSVHRRGVGGIASAAAASIKKIGYSLPVLTQFCEDVVQILVEMKTEGSKYLYLTEGV